MQNRLPLSPFKILDPHHHKRQHGNAVQPHQVEIVSDDKAAKRKHQREHKRHVSLAFALRTEIPGRGKTAKSDLDHDQKCHRIHHISLREKHNQEIQRARQIIGIRCPEIKAQSSSKRIAKGTSLFQFFMEFRKKRKILVE